MIFSGKTGFPTFPDHALDQQHVPQSQSIGRDAHRDESREERPSGCRNDRRQQDAEGRTPDRARRGSGSCLRSERRKRGCRRRPKKTREVFWRMLRSPPADSCRGAHGAGSQIALEKRDAGAFHGDVGVSGLPMAICRPSAADSRKAHRLTPSPGHGDTRSLAPVSVCSHGALLIRQQPQHSTSSVSSCAPRPGCGFQGRRSASRLRTPRPRTPKNQRSALSAI